MKVAINTTYGGFSLSENLFEELLKLKGIKYFRWRNGLYDDFTTIPQEEYKRLEQEDANLPYSKRNLRTNECYINPYDFYEDRTDPELIEIVECFNPEDIKVVEIPDDVEWYIEEDDGMEWVAEKHRTWQ